MNNQTLFLAADYEAQKLCNISSNELNATIQKHFIYSVLLSDSVIIPVGAYYQSHYTQAMTAKYFNFFRTYKANSPVVEYAIGNDRNSFYEDAKIKETWFPDEYQYRDEERIKTLSKRLIGITPAIRNSKMRNVLTQQISTDIDIGGVARRKLEEWTGNEDESVRIIEPLRVVIEEQKYAMLPVYIEMEMHKQRVSSCVHKRIQKRWLEFILFKGYAQSCELSYKCFCNNPLSTNYNNEFKHLYPYKIDYRDTHLFDIFLQLFPFKWLNRISNLTDIEVMQIKYSSEFQEYLLCYRKIINSVNDELESVLLETDNQCRYYVVLNDKRKDDYTCYIKSLTENINDAIVLYRLLRRTPKKLQKFGKWLENNDINIPTLQVLTYIKDKQNGLYNDYISVLYEHVKHLNRERKIEMSKKNFVFNLLGKVNAKQEISSNRNSQEDSYNSHIGKDAFMNVDWLEIELFIDSIDNPALTDAKDYIIHLLCSGKYGSEQCFNKDLIQWNESKKTLSNTVLDSIKTMASASSIGTFLLQLLNL